MILPVIPFKSINCYFPFLQWLRINKLLSTMAMQRQQKLHYSHSWALYYLLAHWHVQEKNGPSRHVDTQARVARASFRPHMNIESRKFPFDLNLLLIFVPFIALRCTYGECEKLADTTKSPSVWGCSTYGMWKNSLSRRIHITYHRRIITVEMYVMHLNAAQPHTAQDTKLRSWMKQWHEQCVNNTHALRMNLVYES